MTAGLADDLATSLWRREADRVDNRVQAQKLNHAKEQRLCMRRAASAGVSAPGLEALPQPRATHDAEKGLAATRRWQTLTRAQGTRSSARPRR